MKVILFISVLAQSALYKKGLGKFIYKKHIGLTLQLDLLKSYLSTHINFATMNKPIVRRKKMSLKKEMFFYGKIVRKSLLPKFFLVEFDYFPLTSFGVYYKKHQNESYQDFNLSNESDLNFIKLISSKYERPYSLSFFLGDIIPFFSYSKKREKVQSGSSIVGHVFTLGRRTIFNLELKSDKWFQYGYKIKGTDISKKDKKKWSLELGFIKHENSLFYDSIVLNLVRDSASRVSRSIAQNLKIEYFYHFAYNNRKSLNGIKKFTTFQKLVFGRNFPFKKFIFGLDFGIKWEAFNNIEKESDLTFILAPNISW